MYHLSTPLAVHIIGGLNAGSLNGRNTKWPKAQPFELYQPHELDDGEAKMTEAVRAVQKAPRVWDDLVVDRGWKKRLKHLAAKYWMEVDLPGVVANLRILRKAHEVRRSQLDRRKAKMTASFIQSSHRAIAHWLSKSPILVLR